MKDDWRADVIVVGAGSAGCALAARLSESPQLQVLLVEAGTPRRNPWIDIPIGYFKTVGDPAHDWGFQTQPDERVAGRALAWPRGKGLGGSSLINGMLYLRGHRRDYDQWAAMGNPGWSWDAVLPLFKRASHRAEHATATCGQGGPLWVSDIPRDPLSDAFIEAARRTGIAPTADFNGGDNQGVGYFQMTTRGGRRMSAARAYLEPARKRPNLRIVTGAQVAALRFEGERVVGLEWVRAGQRERAWAAHEVVLCAGAVQSPQILMLSGIGRADELSAMGITPRHALAGVGANLQDHLQVRPAYRCQGVETLNDIANSRWRSAREFLRYQVTRSGALRNGVYRAGAFLSVGDGPPDWPNVQIHFGLVSFDRPHQPPHAFSGVTLSACLLRPSSRGRITLASADPLVAPQIHADYLSTEDDQRLAVAMVRRMRDIARRAPLSESIIAEHEPGEAVQGDAALLDWVRRRSASIFHPVGTCAMGPLGDPEAVVDARLRVHGLCGLRVADGSIMPRVVSGNTHAPIVMIGEKAAEMIHEDLGT